MQFDWFTFVAQIINFVILIILLQRFLYRPIVQAMQAREEKIVERYQNAEAQAVEAHRQSELFREKREDLEEQRSVLLADAAAAAQQQRKQLLEEARQEVDATRDRWFSAIAREKAIYLQSLRQQVSRQLFTIVERALKDLANASLEAQIVTVFSQRLQQLDDHEAAILAQAIQNSTRQAVVRSAFELSEGQQATLRSILLELFKGQPSESTVHQTEAGSEIKILFEENRDLLCGIELQVYGHRISWSLQDYVETLEQHLTGIFDGERDANHLNHDGASELPMALT